jgi:cytochrome c551/c552
MNGNDGLDVRRAAPLTALALAALSSHAQTLIGEEPALGRPEDRVSQAEIESGQLSLHQVRSAGLKVFATRFRKADGFGDGPLIPGSTTDPGGRPMLQGNGTFLRVNGLDAQACLDCHTLLSADVVPALRGVGGAGGINDSAVFQGRMIDVADNAGNGFAGVDGRVINPPALFGTGAVQLLAREMSTDLQQLARTALRQPGRRIELRTHGVSFGSISADALGYLDTSEVEGIDDDLIVRPFGRKGEFETVRQFDLVALSFHMGMQPEETVGSFVDADLDGVVNEVSIGEVSALEVFVTTQETPIMLPPASASAQGSDLFRSVGCTDCHMPLLETRSPILTYSYPEVAGDPLQNVFYAVDLRDAPARLEESSAGGLLVPMFSDLKRHDMGPGLAEDFHRATAQQNREFITAKLWGVADTAPYLHDGRALTLNEAITLHGGEAADSRNAYVALSIHDRNLILEFLRTLRNPVSPNADVLDCKRNNAPDGVRLGPERDTAYASSLDLQHFAEQVPRGRRDDCL